MRGSIFKWGGIAASVILIAFGIGSIAVGAWGINYTRDQLKNEQIVGSPDMTPDAIKAEGEKAGLTNVDYPTCDVAGETVDTGQEAKCFASYMRIHALEATGGQTVLRDGPVPRREGQSDLGRVAGREGSEDGPAGRERPPEPLGDRDRADHRAQRLVLRGERSACSR